jgi:hypothetical protein
VNCGLLTAPPNARVCSEPTARLIGEGETINEIDEPLEVFLTARTLQLRPGHGVAAGCQRMSASRKPACRADHCAAGTSR